MSRILRWRLFVITLATVVAAGSLVPVSSIQAVGGTVVIAEFRTRGPGGASDEFVELFNRSGAAVDVGGWELWGSNGSGGAARRATLPEGTVIPPGCRFLLARGTYYSGVAVPDLTYGTAVTDDGGIALCSGACDQAGMVVDQVGMSAGSAYGEGTPLSPTATSQEQSYERRPAGVNDQDSDDNAADFLFNEASSNPQNAAAGCSPLAVTLVSFAAAPGPGHMLITWETAGELDSAGFNLWRGLDPAAPARLLAFVPSQGPGSGQGFLYHHQDLDVTAGQTYFYWLEALDLGGASTWHGPVSATYQVPTAVALTGFEAQPPGPFGPLAGVAMLVLALLALSPLRRRLDHR